MATRLGMMLQHFEVAGRQPIVTSDSFY